MNTKKFLIYTICLFLVIFGVIGMRQLAQRWARFQRDAGYHAYMEDYYIQESKYWYMLSSDTTKKSQLTVALYKSGHWSRENAVSTEVALLDHTNKKNEHIYDNMRTIAFEKYESLRKLADRHKSLKRSKLNMW